MTTFMAKAATVERKWYLVDAEGMVLGRLASQVAHILRGKHKPTYTPHTDTGDHVIIINADKVVLTGRKLDQKIYYHHTGYPGGLKKTPYRKLMQDKPEFAVKHAIVGMLPKGPLGARWPPSCGSMPARSMSMRRSSRKCSNFRDAVRRIIMAQVSYQAVGRRKKAVAVFALCPATAKSLSINAISMITLAWRRSK